MSGGQQKRVNVALELLTKPSLLFLDEPTSGLDPGLDMQVMEMMSGLARDGRTVVVVTHSVANLDTCDRLLVLAPGGRLAFYGPPAEALPYFALPGWAELFQAFERYPDRAWGQEFEHSTAKAQWAEVPAVEGSATPNSLQPGAPTARRSRLRQTMTLTRRYARVIAADRGYVLFLALLPLVLGLLLHFVPASEGLAGAPGTNVTAQELLQIMVTCACLTGTACSVRELVKERAIYTRERAAGLSSGAYLFSKLLVLGAISILQSVVIVLFGLAGRALPAHGAYLTTAPLVELLIAVALLAMASMCLGLLVSAVITTSEKAMPILVMVTMAQIILSGGAAPVRAGRAFTTVVDRAVPLGLQRGGRDGEPQPARAQQHRSAMASVLRGLATGRGHHRGAGGAVPARRLAAIAPPRAARPPWRPVIRSSRPSTPRSRRSAQR
jgi:hypothetical protein